MVRRAVLLGVATLGVALGIVALDTAQDDPGYWFGGSSTLAAVALLGAGWALIGCGLSSWWRRPDSRFGLLLAGGGFAWFLPELNNPGADSSLAFTAGLAFAAACTTLVGHAVLAYPTGRLSSARQRVGVVVAYAGAFGVLGVLPAVLSDPRAHGCNQCPDNLLLVADRSSAAEDFAHVGVYLGLGWASFLGLLAVARLVAAAPAARLVFAAGGVYLALAASTFAVSLERGVIATGTLERRLWLGQAAALVALAAAVAWSWVRARRARASVARLVVDLAQSPPPGGLRGALAEIVGDPELVLTYPVGGPGGLVDAHGRPVELPAGRGRTTLVRDGRPVAVLGHAPGLLDDEQLVDEVTTASRLALENERLQAEVRARVEELRASRARIVEAGDAERKRLERDLHDGAQQRLVGLSLSLRLLQGQVADSPKLRQAEDELRFAIIDLRELAHGIFPAVLADEGLAAAIEALAEDGEVAFRIGALPEERFAASVESAAYTVVAEATRAATGAVSVRAERSNGVLAIDVETNGIDGLDLVGLQDRVGALEGRLEVASQNGHVRIHAELPCES